MVGLPEEFEGLFHTGELRDICWGREKEENEDPVARGPGGKGIPAEESGTELRLVKRNDIW